MYFISTLVPRVFALSNTVALVLCSVDGAQKPRFSLLTMSCVDLILQTVLCPHPYNVTFTILEETAPPPPPHHSYIGHRDYTRVSTAYYCTPVQHTRICCTENNSIIAQWQLSFSTPLSLSLHSGHVRFSSNVLITFSLKFPNTTVVVAAAVETHCACWSASRMSTRWSQTLIM